MARKMQVIHGGVVRKAKKLQTVYGGVVKNAKSAWMVSNGLWRKFFSGSPVAYSFALQGFPLDPANTNTAVSAWANITSWSAGFNDNGDIKLSIYTKNSGTILDGAPSARVTMTFADPASAVGAFIKFTYNNGHKNDKTGNYFYFEYTQNGAKKRQGFSPTWGNTWSSFTVPEGTSDVAFVMVLGRQNTDGYDDYGNVTITSITMAGEEILH